MAKSKLLTRKLVIGMVALALAAGATGWYVIAGGGSEASALTDLDAVSFAQLQSEFNHAAGDVRALVLLSPT